MAEKGEKSKFSIFVKKGKIGWEVALGAGLRDFTPIFQKEGGPVNS